MKKILSLILLFLFLVTPLFGQTSGVTVGLDFILGGRYDDIRMCVASPAGVKGGMIADIILNTKVSFSSGWAVGLKLPLMRPILFAAAFKMLQFEPEFVFEYDVTVNGKTVFTFGPGIGMSFHYGPDYKTDKDAKIKINFPAVGPFISFFGGFGFKNSSGLTHGVGLRAFYIPLIADGHANGTVVGGVLEGRFQLSN